MGDRRISRQQSKGAGRRASGRASNELFKRRGKPQRLFFHVFTQLLPRPETILTRNHELGIVQGGIQRLRGVNSGERRDHVKAPERVRILGPRGAKEGFGLIFELLKIGALR